MKWVYVPIMFALAFIYSKTILTINNASEMTAGPRASRGPASISSGEISNPLIIKKAQPAELYNQLSIDSLTPFAALHSYKGAIVGKVDVESFGYIVDDKKKADFGITDFDEVTNGALFHDVLLHLISIKSLDKKVSWMNYFEFYKMGLMGESHTNSYYIEKGMDEAVIDSQKFVEERMTSDFPIEFKGMSKTHHHVEAVKKSQIQSELKRMFPLIQFFDLYQHNSENGAYEALVRVKPTDKIQWLTMNENNNTHYDKAFNKKNALDFDSRVQTIRHKIYSDKMNKSLFSFKIGLRQFTGKFRENFSGRIKWEMIPEEDFHDCLMDQAYLLGKIHRSSLDSNVDSYIKTWARIPAAIVDEKAVELKFKIKDQVQ